MKEERISVNPRQQLKALNFEHHESIAFTVQVIASSALVKEYIIGYTSRQGLLRREEYRRNGYEHLVILADRLTREEAHWLEEVLQSYILDCKALAVYKKYEQSRRGRRYFPSAGQARSDPDAYIHSVYMAWTEG